MVAVNLFTFGEYVGVSRHVVFDLRGGNPEQYLNSGLDWLHAGFTTTAFWDSLPAGMLQGLAPVPAEWRRFGVIVGASETETGGPEPGVLLRLQTATVQVAVFQEWNPARAASAWEALLTAQDALRPQRLAVPPGFVVSLIALAQLAMHEQRRGSNVLARWRTNIALAQHVLNPVMDTMMQAWLAGSSRAAARYRALMRLKAPKPFRPDLALFRPAEWENLTRVERPEPFLMRLFHEKSLALWRDDALWARARANWSEEEQAAMLGLARWDSVIPGQGGMTPAELIDLRERGPWQPEATPVRQPPVPPPDLSAPRRRGRAVPQITRAPEVPVQPSIWELEGDAEAVARQITLGGQQELELWLALSLPRAAEEVHREYQRWGRGIMMLSVTPESSFRKGEVRAEYVSKADVVAQSNDSSPGDRSVMEFLRSYDPDKEFMVVLVKDDCDPRRLIASYTYSALTAPEPGNDAGLA